MANPPAQPGADRAAARSVDSTSGAIAAGAFDGVKIAASAAGVVARPRRTRRDRSRSRARDNRLSIVPTGQPIRCATS